MTIFDQGKGPQRPEILNRFGEKLSGGSTLRLVFFAAVILIGLLLIGNFLISITRIEAGYTGIEVNLAGSQRGAHVATARWAR